VLGRNKRGVDGSGGRVIYIHRNFLVPSYPRSHAHPLFLVLVLRTRTLVTHTGHHTLAIMHGQIHVGADAGKVRRPNCGAGVGQEQAGGGAGKGQAAGAGAGRGTCALMHTLSTSHIVYIYIYIYIHIYIYTYIYIYIYNIGQKRKFVYVPPRHELRQDKELSDASCAVCRATEVINSEHGISPTKAPQKRTRFRCAGWWCPGCGEAMHPECFCRVEEHHKSHNLEYGAGSGKTLVPRPAVHLRCVYILLLVLHPTSSIHSTSIYPQIHPASSTSPYLLNSLYLNFTSRTYFRFL
jgi:hypothetical protein